MPLPTTDGWWPVAKTRDNPQCSNVQAAHTAAQAGVKHQVRVGDGRRASCLAPEEEDKVAWRPTRGLQLTDASDLGSDIFQGTGVRKKQGLQAGAVNQFQELINPEGMHAGVQEGIGQSGYRGGL